MAEATQTQRWKRAAPPQDTTIRQQIHSLQHELNISGITATLLVQRGIATSAQAKDFLTPSLGLLHDPMKLPGMAVAAPRLVQAVRDKQPIVIYGDYDVDGITASAILYHTLTHLGANVRTYVPHRIDEGYGLNPQAINTLCDEIPPGPQGGVIVSVDCGVTACESAAAARQRGVDLIITDHHHFDPQNLPDALAIVHPALPGSAYPFTDLCGAGVAFKLAWAIATTYHQSPRVPATCRQLLLDMVSLAALGTIADIVPLLDENRTLAHYGLGHLKSTRIQGLNALIDASDLRGEKVNAFHVGFILGPRLNACGRMGHAHAAVELLTTATDARAADLASFLHQENIKRQQTERDITQNAFAIIEENGYHATEHRAIVVANHHWHQGVVGIVASRVVEQYHRPAIVMNIDEQGMAHGSARSVDQVSIHEALCACASLLTGFGGHRMAAGLHLNEQDLPAFRQQLVQWVNQKLTEEDLVQTHHADICCHLDDLNIPMLTELEKLAPFGRCNPHPQFALENLRITQHPRLVGKQGRHLALTLSNGRNTIHAIGFGMGHWREQLAMGQHVDVICRAEINHWQGMQKVQLELQAIRLTQDHQPWIDVPFTIASLPHAHAPAQTPAPAPAPAPAAQG